MDLLKNTICKGITDAEFAMFLWVAKKHKLDPMTRQLHAVKRYIKKHHQDEKGIWVGGEQMNIQIGIDGYRSIAAVNHTDFGGVDEPEYEFAKAGDKVPILARVRVWKKGFDHPSVGVAYWDEYAPSADSNQGFMWNKMPKHMLAKCAEALALRKAYPDLSDIYTDEEMDQHQQDYTPSGRQIVTADGTAPSGVPVTYEAQQQRRQLDTEAPHGHLPGTRAATQAEAQLAKVEEEDRKFKEAQKASQKPPQPQPETSKPPIDVKPTPNKEPTLTAESISPDRFRVIGDVNAVYPMIEKYCKWESDGFWYCDLAALQNMQQMANQFKFRLDVIQSSKPPRVKPAPTAPELLSGNIVKITMGMTSRNAPTRQVKIDRSWYTSYVHPLFEYLDKATGRDVEVWLDAKAKTIVGLKRVGKLEFDADGRTPVVQQSEREAGTQNLFKEP